MPKVFLFRLIIAISAARLSIFFIRLLKLGEASCFPGKIANAFYPKIYQHLCGQVKNGIILIAGTNGKTTTSLLLSKMFLNYKIVHNKSGANFESGLVTALLEKTKINGRLDADFAIFEVDEFALVDVLKKFTPLAIVALNLFRDQLGRYGEIQTILKSWQEAISRLPSETQIFLNADDPAICHLGDQLSQKVIYFGLKEPGRYLSSMPHAVDSIYCPQCDALLSYQGFYLSHLGEYSCPSCGFAKKNPDVDSRDWPQISTEVYNKYNTMAAISVAKQIGIDEQQIRLGIQNFLPAFGRGEILSCNGKKVLLLLSKNPVSMNEMIQRVCRTMKDDNIQTVLLALNDQGMDGTDISWIWDVDVEPLAAMGKRFVLSGSRANELALRFKYSFAEKNDSPDIHIEGDLQKAVALALKHTPDEATLPILPTYSAMLEIRKILIGRKIH